MHNINLDKFVSTSWKFFFILFPQFRFRRWRGSVVSRSASPSSPVRFGGSETRGFGQGLGRGLGSGPEVSEGQPRPEPWEVDLEGLLQPAGNSREKHSGCQVKTRRLKSFKLNLWKLFYSINLFLIKKKLYLG